MSRPNPPPWPPPWSPFPEAWRRAFFVLACSGLTACSNHEMHQQTRFDPLEPAPAWPDSQSALGPPAGAVPRDSEPEVADTSHFPGPPDRPLLERGRERYAIYCAPCHGPNGDGNGMITRHGFPHPPSYQEPRLLAAAPGHFYRVITDGFGMMYPYGYRVPPADRWAIIAYIRALQLSQRAALADAPEAERRRLEAL
jgi:mono/diheme cytochrome c family protein